MGRADDLRTSNRIDRAQYTIGLCYAVVWVLAGIATASGLIEKSPNFIGTPAVFALTALWLFVAFIQFRRQAHTVAASALGLLSYHVLSMIFLVWVLGPSHPLIFTWTLLISASAINFGRNGIIASAALLIGTLVPLSASGSSVWQLATTVGGVIFVGACIHYVLGQTLRDQQDLDESHKQASLQRDRTTTLINNLADAVVSTDQNGKVLLYNAAALNLLDTNSDLEGEYIDEVLQLRTAEGDHVSLADEFAYAKTAASRDDVVTLISGETTRLEVSYSPVRRSYHEAIDSTGEDEDDIDGFIIIIRDITTAKSLEEERDEFISVVSHELRTPITIAEGTVSNAQIMLQRPDTPPEKISSAIDMAHEQIVFLAKMVNDLSTLSRAERGVADDAETIDVNELITSLHQEYLPEASQKGLKFDLHLPPKVGSVHTSRLYLKELLQNFVTNAIKYTAEGTVTVTITKPTDKTVTFAVSDTGIGISKADQKRIFDKFYRAEDYRTRESSGTGLGLYVAHKLARKIDTTIELRSRLNHGSEFSITLPLVTDKKPNKPQKKS